MGFKWVCICKKNEETIENPVISTRLVPQILPSSVYPARKRGRRGPQGWCPLLIFKGKTPPTLRATSPCAYSKGRIFFKYRLFQGRLIIWPHSGPAMPQLHPVRRAGATTTCPGRGSPCPGRGKRRPYYPNRSVCESHAPTRGQIASRATGWRNNYLPGRESSAPAISSRP